MQPAASGNAGTGTTRASLSDVPTPQMMFELARRQRANTHGLTADSKYEQALKIMGAAINSLRRPRSLTNAASTSTAMALTHEIAAQLDGSVALVGGPGGAGPARLKDDRPPLVRWPSQETSMGRSHRSLPKTKIQL